MYILNLNTGLIYGTVSPKQVDEACESLIKEAKRREKDAEAEPYVFMEGDLEEFTGPQLVRIFNANRAETMDPVNKFSDKRTAVKRVKQVLPEEAYKPSALRAEVNKIPPDRRRPQRYHDDARIKVTVSGNPKREGAETFRQFELYRKYKTVGDFVRNGGLLPFLYYDVHKGNVRIEGGGKA